MDMSSRKKNKNEHTVVLKRHIFRNSESLIIGSKQGDFNKTNLSPPVFVPKKVVFKSARPPDKNNKTFGHEKISHDGSGNLLVRFGIDTFKGRVITVVLLFLIFFQPVYVAFGMEVENVDESAVDMPVEQQSSEENSQDDAEIASESEDVQNEQVQTSEEDSQEEVVDSLENDVDNFSDVADENSVVSEDSSNTDINTENQSGDLEDELVDNDDNQTDAVDDDNQTGDIGDNDSLTDTDENEIVIPSATSSTSTSEVDNQNEDEDSNTDTEDVFDENVASSTASSTEQSDDGDNLSGGSSGSGGGSSPDVADDSDENATTTDEVSDETATTTDTNSGSEDSHEDEDASVATSSDENIVATSTGNIATTSATSTDEVDFESEENVTVAKNAENKYTFAEGDCTLVSEGEFYCIKNNIEKVRTGDPNVYAEKDREGDSEIFYFDGVEISRITNNSYDDFAPIFDEKTKTIVWQAMINDRLQIMMHEIPTNTTRQITTTRQNSSNPDIDGDTVVWQEWVDTNWEIMTTNIRNNGKEFDIKQLTDNAVHDMFPQIHNDLISWQREKGSTWEVVVHNVRTGEEYSLEKNEDTKYENPRFVLLFDSKHDNGDVETIGYDLNTGEMMELGTRSKPIPKKPLTPKDKSQDAIPREAASSTQSIKIAREDGGDS